MFSRKTMFALLVAILALPLIAEADENIYCYGPRLVNGRIYYIYLHEYNGTRAELWFRVKKDACSYGDIKVLEIVPRARRLDPKKSLVDIAKTLCEVKKIYDNGKTVVGCVSTTITGVCLVASVPSGGTAAFVCNVSITYTVSKGFVDCVTGIIDWIGSTLTNDRDWAVFRFTTSISTSQMKDAVSYAIDAACAELKQKTR